MPGKGSLTLTGLLGESMRESAQAAMSYLRSHAKLLGIDASWFRKTDIHIHVPAGAVPKDGPSAGVAISSALISLSRQAAIQADMAMTGEVTLTGRVLPVGGVREKVLAARRAGITTVLIPRHNEKDLIELPPEVKADVTFHLIDSLDDVVPFLFSPPKSKPISRSTAPKRSASKAKRKVQASRRAVVEPPVTPLPPARPPAKAGRRNRLV